MAELMLEMQSPTAVKGSEVEERDVQVIVCHLKDFNSMMRPWKITASPYLDRPIILFITKGLNMLRS